jgi:hypothetical protein
LPSPEPIVEAPGTNTITQPVRSANTNTNMTPIEVETAELASLDDNEEDILAEVASLSEILAETVSHLGTAQANIAAAGAELNGLRLGGIGKNCKFSFGPAEITLQTSGPVRSGLTLLMVGIGAFAAASMIRNAVQ